MRSGLLAERLVLAGRHDGDDFERLVGDPDPLADDVRPFPVPVRHRGVDDDDTRGILIVGRSECPAGHNRDLHRPKVIGADDVVVDLHRLAGVRHVTVDANSD